MKDKIKKYNYVEWFSAEEMHVIIKQWLSELLFIKDEQLFLNDLVQSYTLNLIDPTVFQESKKAIHQLNTVENELSALLKMVKTHENLLHIMVDDVDQLELENDYLKKHKELLFAINSYSIKYREIKEKLFTIVSIAMKKDKRLLK